MEFMETIEEIEERIDVAKFIYKGENIWPLIRKNIAWNLTLKSLGKTENETPFGKQSKIKLLFRTLLNIKDIFKLFKKYDIIIFTVDDNYKLNNGEERNRFTFELQNYYKNKKILEFQFNKSKSTNSLDNTEVIDYNLIMLIIYIYSYFVKVEFNNIEEELIKNNIYSKNIIITLKRFISSKYILNSIFKFIKPKLMFSTSYSFGIEIKVANDLKIETFEFQHGVIFGDTNYNITQNINESFYPKTILCFGSNDKKYLNQYNYIINKNNIIPIGNSQIDFYFKKSQSQIENLKNNFKLLICVSLQWTVIESTLNYIYKQADLYKDICFIIIPRKKEDLEKTRILKKNLKIFSHLHFYEIASNCDYHLTVYSSCALEAPSLGVKNIFLNIDNLSNRIYKDFINNYNFNLIINENMNLDSLNLLYKKYDKNQVREQNNENILSDYKINIANVLNNYKI